ncbi:MAG TPA: homoserine O-acetyltransferase, partial [Gammaproteobacteria bacterium]|nr:homoserine O-acetyltransferase [Gammaproteobacteria bacterium]
MQTVARDSLIGAAHVTELPAVFELESGAVLQDVRIAWHSWGQLNSERDNAVIVNHALTGSSDVEAWWPGLLGPGRALDPEHDYIVCANVLGSCYGTTGPASIEPGTGRRYGSRFPEITIRDMVRLQKRLIDTLGIRSVACVIGGSLGGMLTLEWVLLYPDMIRSIVSVAAAATQPAWAIGWSEAQRQAILADPDWQGGDYSQARPPRAGLAAARAMAMLSYRHWDGFQSRFGRHGRDGVYEAQSYLRHHGETFVNRFEASSY